MMNRIRNSIIALGLVLGLGSFMVVPVGAINVYKGCSGGTNPDTTICRSTKTDDIGKLVQNVVSTLLLAVGAIAVVMIIVGGIRYVLSNGDSGQIKSAKDTVLYAVIGLIVSMLAYAIVQFVLAQFK